jgi:hypothetical protein
MEPVDGISPKTEYRAEVLVPKRQVLPSCSDAVVRSALTSVGRAVHHFLLERLAQAVTAYGPLPALMREFQEKTRARLANG